jgi:osmotically-inducible protein OsmY
MLLGASAMLAVAGAMMMGSTIMLSISFDSEALAAEMLEQQVTDARQETQIWTTYALNPDLRDVDLEVTVRKGKATLTGTVEDIFNKDLAKEIALGVRGVDQVDNQIAVQSDYQLPGRSSSRSYRERIDDATITAKDRSKWFGNTCIDNFSTEVNTLGGELYIASLFGTVSAKVKSPSLFSSNVIPSVIGMNSTSGIATLRGEI